MGKAKGKPVRQVSTWIAEDVRNAAKARAARSSKKLQTVIDEILRAAFARELKA